MTLAQIQLHEGLQRSVLPRHFFGGMALILCEHASGVKALAQAQSNRDWCVVSVLVGRYEVFRLVHCFFQCTDRL